MTAIALAICGLAWAVIFIGAILSGHASRNVAVLSLGIVVGFTALALLRVYATMWGVE